MKRQNLNTNDWGRNTIKAQVLNGLCRQCLRTKFRRFHRLSVQLCFEFRKQMQRCIFSWFIFYLLVSNRVKIARITAFPRRQHFAQLLLYSHHELCSSYDVTRHQNGEQKFPQEVRGKIATLETNKIGLN